MSVRDYYREQDKKNIKLNLEVSEFSKIGNWIRTLKYRFKNCEILKIGIMFDIDYMEEEEK